MVDACKLILRRVLAEKADIDTIDHEMIKDNLYSSYFLPPNMIIRLGDKKTLNGFLLWDSIIYFSDMFWQDFNEKEFLKAIKYYQANKR
ncbi:undecaprenyl diphosphate synthase family protein [Thermoproteota archaeon]